MTIGDCRHSLEPGSLRFECYVLSLSGIRDAAVRAAKRTCRDKSRKSLTSLRVYLACRYSMAVRQPFFTYRKLALSRIALSKKYQFNCSDDVDC